jgi:hypothetical protein
MPVPAPLDMKVSPELRTTLRAFLSRITDYEPTLCLMKDTDGRWSYGAYGPENIKHVGADLDRLGHSLLYRADELVFAIPQFQFLSELSGKELALRGKELVVVDRAPGI